MLFTLRLLVSLIFVMGSTYSFSQSVSENEKLYFVQMWTVAPTPNEVDDTENPGRIEVSSDGKFVACAQGYIIKQWNSFDLAPLAVGFMYKGDKSKLKFEAFGEIKSRTVVQTKITEIMP